MVLVNIHKPADENKMDAVEVRQALGIDLLDHNTCHVEVLEMSASNLQQTAAVTQKICNFFTRKQRIFLQDDAWKDLLDDLWQFPW